MEPVSPLASRRAVAAEAEPALDAAAQRRRALAGVEARTVAAVLALQLAARIAYALRARVGTDEPQHLHVAWAWTQGLVPYRDVFDNHAPLFHLALAPLVAALGERADLLIAMRLAMLPVAALLLWSVYRLGAALYDDRVGVWAAALVGLLPAFLFTSVEFRADDLWAALWVTAMATMFAGPFRAGRALATGALIGAAIATSMKSCLLLTALLAAVGASIGMDRGRTIDLRDRRAWMSMGACAAAVAALIGAVLGLFAWLGALHELGHFVVVHNLAAGGRWDHRAARIALFVIATPVSIIVGNTILRESRSRGFARCAVLLSTAFYSILLYGWWPIVTPQDALPLYPILAVFVGAALLELMPAPGGKPAAVLASLAVAQVAFALWRCPLSVDGTRFHVGLVADVQRLTTKSDPVMDLKGETLFRQRPFFYALEDITRQRLRDGDLQDDIAQRLIATRTYVSVVDSGRFPPHARAFLLENYVPVGHLRVAGQFLNVDGAGRADFTIAVPGRYVVLAVDGPAAGSLDGNPARAAVTLAPGPHVYEGPPPTSSLALVWADAAERGFSPFHQRDLE
jgi:Dolichyl-phosphate-mannose-protein mannosyltransferase